MGAGLSSSSALVCCAGLATAYVHQFNCFKKELADVCTVSERYIGTQSGGMDQAISYFGEEEKAKIINFNPLRQSDVLLPPNVVFVISHTLVESCKQITAAQLYNKRVVECRLAAMLMAHSLNISRQDILTSISNLHDLQRYTNLSLSQLIDSIPKALHVHPYTLQEASDLLNFEVEKLKNKLLGNNIKWVEGNDFSLYQRAFHVYTEAARVYKFVDLALQSNIIEIGKIMNQSHESCRDFYDCSCVELNQLVEAALQSGAIGSRLTGAGWGGCTVSIVEKDKLLNFQEKLWESYYLNNPATKDNERTDILFATAPGAGAAILLK